MHFAVFQIHDWLHFFLFISFKGERKIKVSERSTVYSCFYRSNIRKSDVGRGFFVCGCSATLKVSINVQKVSCVAFLINKEM